MAGPFVEELFDQMAAIERQWGRICGYLNWQGVLNIAFELRGQDIFLDIHDRPELADHLFSTIGEVIIRLAQSVQQRQRESGFYVNHLCVSNCTINMISPQAYRRFLFRYDAKIAAKFRALRGTHVQLERHPVSGDAAKTAQGGLPGHGDGIEHGQGE